MKTRARCWKSPSLLETLRTHARSLHKRSVVSNRARCWKIWCSHQSLTTYARSLPKEIGDRSKWTYYKLYRRLKDKYKVNYLCTDGYEAYSSFTLAEKKHTTTKAEIQSPSYASLLAITNLLLGEVWDEFTK